MSWGEVLYCVVNHSALEPSEIAARIGKRLGYLLDAANPDREDMKFQAELLIPIMAVTGNLAPIHYLCQQFNGWFVQLPAGVTTHQEILQTFTHLVTELGQVSAGIETSIADRRVTAEEAKRVTEKIRAFISTGLALISIVDASVGKDAVAS